MIKICISCGRCTDKHQLEEEHSLIIIALPKSCEFRYSDKIVDSVSNTDAHQLEEALLHIL